MKSAGKYLILYDIEINSGRNDSNCKYSFTKSIIDRVVSVRKM